MGTRGRGALLTREAREEANKSRRRLPWTKKGLSRVERVIAFLQFLPVTKGILAGKKMRLLPDQREFVEAVYGRTKRDGRRLISLAIKSAPKGNGKTGFCAGLALCHLFGPEAEPRGEIYSASIDGQHAGKLYAEMEAIILRVPEFAARVNAQRFRKAIEVIEGPGEGATFDALSSDARKAQGLAPSLWIYDELAQVGDRELLDNLLEGMSKRKEALGIIISTQAATDEHPLSQLIDDAQGGADPTTYAHVIAAPDDADPFDKGVLRSVNPAWGKFLDVDDLLKSRDRARRIPAFESSFRNLRLNQRVESSAEERLVTRSVWKGGGASVDRAELAGRLCFGALDLSGKHDLTSFTLVFPTDEATPSFEILPFFWTPEGQLASRQPAEADRFKQWIREGLIISVPGPTIRYSYVASELIKLSKEFDIRAIGYDRWRIDDFRQELSEADADFSVPLEPFGQGFKEMGPAIEWFAELALTARLRHGGHPVLTACVASAVVVSDEAGNQKITKRKSRGPVRTDGAVTLCMALDLFKRFERERESDAGVILPADYRISA